MGDSDDPPLISPAHCDSARGARGDRLQRHTEPTATSRPALPPPGPALIIAASPSADVRYSANGGVVEITNARIVAIDGTEFGGGRNANVQPGATITVTGNYAITSKITCDGCLATAYLGWITGSGDPAGAMNIVLNETDGLGLPLTGTFTGTTRAPSTRDTYYMGAGQVSSTQFNATLPGFFGKLFDQTSDAVSNYSFRFRVDWPAIEPVVTTAGLVSSDGWYRGDVTVGWTLTDPNESITSKTGCDPVTVSTNTPGTAFTCAITSANGPRSRSVTIKRDATRPSVSGLKVTPASNAAGWWNSDVMVTWDCTDETSGPKEPTGSVTFTTEGGERGVAITCTDNAGNVNSSTLRRTGWFLIDKTPPTLAPTFSSATIYVGDAVTAAPNAADALSGIATESCGEVVTSALGTFSVSCTATDKADNTATKSVNYTVIRKLAFSGFKSPITPSALNSANAGSTVPVKFSLGGNEGLAIFAAGSPSSKPTACPTSASVSTVAASTAKGGTSSLTYDPLTDTYTYLWKTEKSWAGTCRTLVVKLTDLTEHTADFQFKK